jgi:hypothetical protein
MPATGERRFLMLAASALTAVSNAKGPSSTAPVICPRSAILQSAAASIVETICDVTVSTAERMATLGLSTPIACASSIELLTISTFSSSDGAMLIAASVIIRGRGYAPVSRTNA